MATSDWLAIIAILVSLAGWCTSARSTRAAERSADEARRSADAAVIQAQAAEKQLKLMEEQREAEKAALDRPQISISVQRVKYGSFITLVNSGAKVVVLQEITIRGNKISFENFQWREISVPKYSSVAPGAESYLFHAVGKVTFNGLTMKGPLEWEPFSIKFNYGNHQTQWCWTGEISITADGIFNVREIDLMAA